MKCPHCNQEHPEGTKFCPETGKKMPPIVGCTNKDCPNYGRSDLPVHYKFCPECGSPLFSLQETKDSLDNIHRQDEKDSCPYDKIEFFHDGMAIVQKNGKYGYIDKYGTEVIECKYDNASYFREGLAYVYNYGEKRKFIDKNGNEVFWLDDNLDLYGFDVGFSEGLCKVGNKIEDDSEEDEEVKFGFIDRKGNLVIDCQFDGASDFHDGRALVWDCGDEDDYGHCEEVNFRFIDVDGYEVIGSFDSAIEFRDGYAAIQIETLPKRPGNYKTRVIDVDGKNVYKIDMHDPLRSSWHSDWAYNYGLHDNVFRYSWREWIDLNTGKKHKYSDYDLSMDERGFFGSLIAVKDKSDKWGFMNVDGDVVIECQFEDEHAPNFSEGLVCVKQNGLYGFIDRMGKVVISYQYTEASSFSEGRAIVKINDNLMVIDNNGNRIV